MRLTKKQKSVIEYKKNLDKRNTLIVYGILAFIMWIATVFIGHSIINWWTNTFEWQRPIYIYSPLVKKGKAVELIDKKLIDKVINEELDKITPNPKKESKAIVKEVLANEDIFSKYKNPVTLRKIYQLESSSGVNDDCKNQGKFNGFGYRQNKNEHICFKTFDEVIGYVDEWIEDNKSVGLAKMLCYYQSGIKFINCEYYQNFINLK
jgi:hypothetical protein